MEAQCVCNLDQDWNPFTISGGPNALLHLAFSKLLVSNFHSPFENRQFRDFQQYLLYHITCYRVKYVSLVHISQ